MNKFSLAVIKSERSVPMLRPGTVLAVGAPGRKSGTYRLTPMACVKESDVSYKVVAEHGLQSDWVRNAGAAKVFDVWVAGSRFSGSLEAVPADDPAAVRRQMKSRLVALTNRALAHKSAVFRILLSPMEEQNRT